MTRLLAALALLLACALAVRSADAVPGVVPATAIASLFSAERAMGHVREIARVPHPIGNPEQVRVRNYIGAELRALGLTPEVQRTTAIGTRFAEAGQVHNVLARMPGTQAGGRAVLLMAHYDAVPAAPGAGDDASGASVLLETLRALRAGPPLPHDVIALFTDGEEAGLLGAAAFVREHPWAKDVGVTMSFEARGTRGPSLMFETGPGNLDVVRELRRVRGARATSLSTFVYRRLPNDTDLSELAVLEGPALNFAFIGGVERYHTAQDDVAHLDARSVQHHGNSAVALTRAFASGPMPRPGTTDAVFFDLPLAGLIVYRESWALPLAVVGLVLVALALIPMPRTEPRWLRGMLLGIAGTVTGVACGALVGIGLATGLGRLHSTIGSGSPTLSGLYVLATASLAFAAAAALYAILRRWSSASALHFGALVTGAVVSLAVSLMAPALSFLFTWPLLAVAAATAISRWWPSAELVASVAGGVVAIFILVPTIYTMGAVALGLDATGGAIIALFTAFGAWLLAPGFELWPERAGRTSVIAAAAGVVLLVVGALTVRTDIDHPVGANFGYGVDADSGGAWLGAHATTAWARERLTADMKADMTADIRTDIKADIKADMTTDTRAETVAAPVWFIRFFRAPGVVRAPMTKLSTATVRLVSDSTLPASRHVVVHVRPAPGTRRINMRVASEAVRRASIDGRVVDTTRFRYTQRASWLMNYFAPPDSGFTIAFTLPPNTQPTLELVSVFPGIPEPVRLRLPERRPGMIPIQEGDVTLVHQRFRM